MFNHFWWTCLSRIEPATLFVAESIQKRSGVIEKRSGVIEKRSGVIEKRSGVMARRVASRQPGRWRLGEKDRRAIKATGNTYLSRTPILYMMKVAPGRLEPAR